MPKVSVVIPAYNAMAYLPETMRSALAQDFADFELIVVDDGSKDDIAAWFEKIRDPRAKLVRQENRGLAGARNRGIEECKGEYIAFLDADDLWRADKLRRQAAVLDADPMVGLVYCWIEIIDQHGSPRHQLRPGHGSEHVWRVLMERNVVECGSTPMVRRRCFDELGVFDCSLGSAVEDRDMWLRIAARYAFAVVEEPLVQYRHHAGSASRNWRAMEESTRRVNEKALAANPLGLPADELEIIGRRASARGALRLAWKPLQSAELDLAASSAYAAAAVRDDPAIASTSNYRRLRLAQTALRLGGRRGYAALLNLADRLRRIQGR
jgi:glycosyltransferase involved in cell wall biosynthesis